MKSPVSWLMQVSKEDARHWLGREQLPLSLCPLKDKCCVGVLALWYLEVTVQWPLAANGAHLYDVITGCSRQAFLSVLTLTQDSREALRSFLIQGT